MAVIKGGSGRKAFPDEPTARTTEHANAQMMIYPFHCSIGDLCLSEKGYEIKIRGVKNSVERVWERTAAAISFLPCKEQGFTQFLIINYEWADQLRAISDIQVEHDWRCETGQIELRTWGMGMNVKGEREDTRLGTAS
ncbi:hypothetical protein TNIN_45941 [Trichonephila inaurata madagascariensis]|uniref:Uncharacterized protein n=1 Tax=Trichonephila inaurata madagascariensis TaxID=2747483 RepID=A0A8X6WMS6_9ARAC|nr:hypothetical protein TNIN_45941 [Trichonephila inaurata madagascariensis]